MLMFAINFTYPRHSRQTTVFTASFLLAAGKLIFPILSSSKFYISLIRPQVYLQI